MKKIVSLFLSVVMLFGLTIFTNISASADEYILSTNNTWITGNITNDNIYDWYKLTINSDGILLITNMHYFPIDFDLYNEDLSECYCSTHENDGSNISPASNTYEYVLSKGTYFLRFHNTYGAGYYGKYKVKSSFTSFNNMEYEPNNFDNAMNLSLNTLLIGAITLQDDMDWYKINIPVNSNVTISLKHYFPIDFDFYNKDLSINYTSTHEASGSYDSPNTEIYNYKLSKGTYYLRIHNTYGAGYYGKYDIKVNSTVNIANPSTLKVSTRNTTSLKLSWGKVSNVSGYQLQQKSGSTYKTVANTTATSYTVKNLSAGNVYTFRVRAYKTVNGTKYYSSWKTLSTITKPAAPSIKTPSTNSKHQIIVKWSAVSKGTGYQVQYSKKKNFSSVIATKTVSGRTKTSYTGKNFTKGKTYYVRVRTYKTYNNTKYYSAWSSVKSIKCK